MSSRRGSQAALDYADVIAEPTRDERRPIQYANVVGAEPGVSVTIDWDGTETEIAERQCFGGVPEIGERVAIHQNGTELNIISGATRGRVGSMAAWRDVNVAWRSSTVAWRQGGFPGVTQAQLALALFAAALYTNEQVAWALFMSAQYTNQEVAKALMLAAQYTNQRLNAYPGMQVPPWEPTIPVVAKGGELVLCVIEGPCGIGAPVGTPVAGDKLDFVIVQDAVGLHGVLWDPIYEPSLVGTAPNERTCVTYRYTGFNWILWDSTADATTIGTPACKLAQFPSPMSGLNSSNSLTGGANADAVTLGAAIGSDVEYAAGWLANDAPGFFTRTLPNGEWRGVGSATGEITSAVFEAEIGRDDNVAPQFLATNWPRVYDAHNCFGLGVSLDSRIHCVANIHGNPLKYVWSDDGGSTWVAPPFLFNAAQEKTFSTGPGDPGSQFTYPQFIRMPSTGTLILIIRAGYAGLSDWAMYKYDHIAQTWSRLPSATTFWVASGGEGPYPSRIVPTADGRLAVFCTFRQTETTFADNRDVRFAWLDGIESGTLSATKADGTPIAMPLTHANMDVVRNTGVAALVNSGGADVDSLGRPHVVYWGATGFGNTNYFHCYFDGTAWQTEWVTDYTEEIRFENHVWREFEDAQRTSGLSVLSNVTDYEGGPHLFAPGDKIAVAPAAVAYASFAGRFTVNTRSANAISYFQPDRPDETIVGATGRINPEPMGSLYSYPLVRPAVFCIGARTFMIYHSMWHRRSEMLCREITPGVDFNEFPVAGMNTFDHEMTMNTRAQKERSELHFWFQQSLANHTDSPSAPYRGHPYNWRDQVAWTLDLDPTQIDALAARTARIPRIETIGRKTSGPIPAIKASFANTRLAYGGIPITDEMVDGRLLFIRQRARLRTTPGGQAGVLARWHMGDESGDLAICIGSFANTDPLDVSSHWCPIPGSADFAGNDWNEGSGWIECRAWNSNPLDSTFIEHGSLELGALDAGF